MKSFVMAHDFMARFVKTLAQRAPVYIPAELPGGDVLYSFLDLTLPCTPRPLRPLTPAAREFLFGQVQDMIRYSRGPEGVTLESLSEAEETIILGLPACDVEGIAYDDHFFCGREFNDFYYHEARRKLTLISFVCNEPPMTTCFCGSMREGGPHASGGYDLQVTALADSYFVEVGTEKGVALIDSGRELFRESSATEREDAVRLWKRAKNLTSKDVPPIGDTLRAMAARKPDDLFFEEYARRCISCGGCNYSCPTCTCFNVMDRGSLNEGLRSRVMDSCIFSGYYRMAGGHVARATVASRTAQRYFCKLLWDEKKFGRSGCVGCGRCITTCPVAIDIRDVMRRLVEAGR
jgi:sulfhydrogenase subunit beta (sulfur reductase)